MQHKIKTDHKLLDKNGRLLEQGYSNNPLYYQRQSIKRHLLRIAERDCYYISNRKFGLYIVIADYTLTGYISVVLADFEKGTIRNHTITRFFPLGRMKMPTHPENGETVFSNNKCGATIVSTLSKKFIKCDFIDFYDHENLYINLTLEYPEYDTVFTARGDNYDRYAFSYSCFKPGMLASGIIRCGIDEYTADNEHTFALLNQTRTNLSRKDICSSLFINHYLINSSQFALRLCDGNANSNTASDNIIVKDGKTDKLDTIKIKASQNNSCIFTEQSHGLNMRFSPLEGVRGIMKAMIYDKYLIFGKIEGETLLQNDDSLSVDRLPAIMEIPIH